MSNWFHRFFNPHCEHCAEEKREEYEREREDRVCSSCEMLRNQIQLLHEERNRLLDKILEEKIEIPKEPENTELKPITKMNFVPFRVKRQMLEAEDRIKASLLKKKTQELEESMGIGDAIPRSNAQVQTRNASLGFQERTVGKEQETSDSNNVIGETNG